MQRGAGLIKQAESLSCQFVFQICLYNHLILAKLDKICLMCDMKSYKMVWSDCWAAKIKRENQ